MGLGLPRLVSAKETIRRTLSVSSPILKLECMGIHLVSYK
jgi:hypothetical protein